MNMTKDEYILLITMSCHIFALCIDALSIIAANLSSCDCISFAHTCRTLNARIHQARKRVLLTNNVFEAVRCKSLLSFKYTLLEEDVSLVLNMRDIDKDILLYLYNDCPYMLKYKLRQRVAYKLCKIGVFAPIDGQTMVYSLIIHAITYNKPELLSHMQGECSDEFYQRACACGYAKIGDYERFIRCRYSNDLMIERYAHIGGNADIIKIASGGQHISLTPKMKGAIMHDDPDRLGRVGSVDCFFMKYVVRYNALKVVNTCNPSAAISYIATDIEEGIAIRMTMEMANALLDNTNSHPSIVKFIVSSRNYRLTEMLRARGLYDKELTIESSHHDFV